MLPLAALLAAGLARSRERSWRRPGRGPDRACARLASEWSDPSPTVSFPVNSSWRKTLGFSFALFLNHLLGNW